jgi:hypothetical protein
MPEWVLAVVVGAIAASPALITAILNYYRNKADVAETYEGIAHRAAIECERLRKERNEWRLKYEELFRKYSDLNYDYNLLINNPHNGDSNQEK